MSKNLLKKYLEEVEGLNYEELKSNGYLIFHDKKFKLQELDYATTNNSRFHDGLFGGMGYRGSRRIYMDMHFIEEGTRDGYNIELTFADGSPKYNELMNLLEDYYSGSKTKIEKDIDLSNSVQSIEIEQYISRGTAWDSDILISADELASHTHTIDRDDLSPDVYVAGGANVVAQEETDIPFDVDGFAELVDSHNHQLELLRSSIRIDDNENYDGEDLSDFFE